MMIYKLALCLFIAGAAITGLNDSGIFTTAIPEPNINQISQDDVVDLTNAAGNADVNPVFTLSIIAIAAKSLFMGLVSVVSIIPLLLSMGVPGWIAIMIQGPIWLVMAAGLYQIFTGNRLED